MKPIEHEYVSHVAYTRALEEYCDTIEPKKEWKAAHRKWQGLEAEDLAQINTDEFWQIGNHMAIAMAVEDQLKKKNT